MFYKKDTDRNQLNGTDDDWDDPDTVVAEVKSNKKALNKISDSDFEADLDRKDQPEKRLQRTSELRSSKRGQNTMLSSNDQVSKRNNNFVYERGASKKIK